MTLSVVNTLSWCTITEEGGAPFSTSSKTFDVPKGSVVHLTAAPGNATFVWGYWTGTDGAEGGNDTQSSTVVTMDADKTVHLNAEGARTRAGHPGLFLGSILEGPYEWRVRPVGEIFYEPDLHEWET